MKQFLIDLVCFTIIITGVVLTVYLVESFIDWELVSVDEYFNWKSIRLYICLIFFLTLMKITTDKKN